MAKTLSLENCDTIIEKLLGTKEYHVEAFEVVPFRHPLQGLIGEHLTLKIDYVSGTEKKNQEFFVKALSSNPVLIEISRALIVFEKEEFFYNILEEFRRYKIDTSFAPKGYLFTNSTTVLEDVCLSGYKGTPKLQLLDRDHCKTAMEALAKFHGASIIYEKKKSVETGKKFCFLEQFPEELEDKVASGRESIATRWFESAIRGVFALIDLIPENRVSNDQFKLKLSQILEASAEEPKGLINAILHNDLWTSNILYTYNANNSPQHAKLLDFQTLTYGPIEVDLMKFFMTNTTRQFRQENMTDLIEVYYKNLMDLLITNGVNNQEISLPPSSTPLEFIESCGNFALAGKVHAIVDHSFTFMSDEVYGDVLRTEETFRNFLFDGRAQFIIESFQKNEKFRSVLSEDVSELRDLLFDNPLTT